MLLHITGIYSMCIHIYVNGERERVCVYIYTYVYIYIYICRRRDCVALIAVIVGLV